MVLLAASLAALVVLFFRTDLNLLEVCGLLLAACIARGSPRLGNRRFQQAERWFHAVARRRAWATALVGVLAIVLRLAVLPIAPAPQPVVVDEFSHRLLAETLLLGRVSNPTHPMWAHMETMQVIQKPTYASMYLPGQGIFLALGKWAAGSLWAGVVLSVALMSMAICWALQGWLPPGWALLGGLIAVLRFGLFSYWMNSYWGGAVSALGGALLIGAWPRIKRRMGVGSSVLMGMGAALLAISRPFEGLMVSLPVACAVLFWLARLTRSARLRAAGRVMAPIFSVLALTGGLLAAYDARVTGDPFRLPYAVNQQTYGWPLTLPWFRVEAHTHSSKAMHDYYLWEMAEHSKITHVKDHLFANIADGMMLWTFFAGPALTVFLIFLPRTLRDRRVRLPVAVCAAGLMAVAVEQSRYPHYFAPATAAFLILLLQSARHMRARGARSAPALLAMARLVPMIVVLVVVARAAVPALRTRDSAMGHYMSWCCGAPGNLERARVLEQLDRTAGQHLVIVRYGPQHDALREWVYNEPRIDAAKVVWARDMGDLANQELMRYFASRRIWLLVVDDDAKSPSLGPYPAR
jgi:hypothetical protein